MHIRSIRLKGLPPIDDLYLECNERVNLFIGPNASGKSTILRAIERLLSEGDKNAWSRYAYIIYDHKGHPVQVSEEDLQSLYDLEDELAAAEDAKENDIDKEFWLDKIDDITEHIYQLTYERLGHKYPVRVEVHPSLDWINWGAMPPLLYIPATRISLPPQDIFNQTIKRPEPYGAGLTWNDIFNRHFGNYVGDFNGEYVEDAFPRLREEIGTNRSHQNQLIKARNLGYSCAKSICDEVIYDDMAHDYVEVRDEDDAEEHEQGFYPTGRIIHSGMGIGTKDDITGEPLYAGALSSGTQGTLLWIWALAYKMARHYNWEEGWEKKPAILLIDEIENHLHPTWQRRVIPALLKHFPKLQIFATTHSPFVVAGREAGQVHLMKRDEETARVTATTNEKDIVGWTMDEILRTMMGVDDPTDDATAAAARELRQLRNEWPRSSPEGEQKRQERIAELRQKVDRDLLAGGPWKRRREEFAERFQAALEKHGLPLDLGQENG